MTLLIIILQGPVHSPDFLHRKTLEVAGKGGSPCQSRDLGGIKVPQWED
jgi:hypothetical protein